MTAATEELISSSRVMDLAVHPERLRQVRDLHQPRDAALDHDVAAQEVGRAPGDPRDEGLQAAGRDLGGEQRMDRCYFGTARLLLLSSLAGKG
jgi:hypothetical protein